MSIADEIAKLQALLNSGALSQEEFATQKSLILAGGHASAANNSRIGVRSSGMSVPVTTILALSAIPVAFVLFAYIMRYGGPRPLTSDEVWGMMNQLAPVGPNFIVTAFAFLWAPVFALLQLVAGVALLTILYFLIKNERKLVSNAILAAILSSVIYCIIALAGSVVARQMEFYIWGGGIESAIITFIFLLIIRIVLAAVAKLQSRG